MDYTIPEINDGVAKIVFSDGSYTFLRLKDDMTEAELDDFAYRFASDNLKTGGSVPSFLSAGASRTAAPINHEETVDNTPQRQRNREVAYGTVEEQIEYITENGLEAWQTKVAQIKADNPKT